MKYRTDFVTNSSSSCSVIYKVSIMVTDSKKTRDLLAYKVEGEDQLHDSLRGIQTAINIRLGGYKAVLEAYRSVFIEKIIELNHFTTEDDKQIIINVVDDIIATPCTTFDDFENSKLWTMLGKGSNETLLFLDESLEAFYISGGSEKDYSYDSQGEYKREVIDFRDFDRRYEKLKCPKCNKKMTMRVSKFGPFYGCSNYPKCTGKLKIADRHHHTEGDFFIVKDKSGESILKMYNGTQTNVIIPEEVNVIGEKAFQGCKFIENITIPSSVTRIEKYAFQQCSGIKELIIPDSVTFIGESAFKWCYSLTSITIPDSVTEISDRLFYEVFSLREVNLPDTIISMGNRVFYKCESLKNIQLPSEITEISEGMFQECVSLVEVKAPGKIKKIHEKGFYGCSKLKFIELSSNFDTFGNEALQGCKFISRETFKPLEVVSEIAKPNQIWVTTEIPKSLGKSPFSSFNEINSLVLLCNNYSYLVENLTQPIDVQCSYTFIYTNRFQSNQIRIVSLSNEFTIKVDTVDKVMADIDKKIIELDRIKGYYGTQQTISCKLMYFRLRSFYDLEDSIKESYISVSRKHFKIIVKDLIEREGYQSLVTLIETGVVTSRNISNIIEKYSSDFGDKFISKMNELKSVLKR